MFQFGIGGLFGNPNGGNEASPANPIQFGTLQDVQIEIDQKLVPLYGQNKFPEDVAPSDMKVTGKGGFANINVDVYNQLYFADTISTGIKIVASNEAGTVPAMTTFTIVVANAGSMGVNYVLDLGVRYAATGKKLFRVASGPTIGEYSVSQTGSTAGTYTFAAADASAAVLISYVYTASSTGRTLTVTNHIQGYGPTFELYALMSYQGTSALHLYNCRASKMSAPFKRDNYIISDFEFEGYANAAGNVMDFFDAVD